MRAFDGRYSLKHETVSGLPHVTVLDGNGEGMAVIVQYQKDWVLHGPKDSQITDRSVSMVLKRFLSWVRFGYLPERYTPEQS